MNRRMMACVLAGAGLTAGMAQSGEVADRLGRLAGRLGEEYSRRAPGADRIPLAVMDFSCGGELARQRAGFAVSELLRIRLAGVPRFALTERTEIDRVLREQSLQLTGAVSQSTAVTVGRLVGVRLLVLGSIERLGGVNQVNARIVEVETGSVVAASFEELPVEAFEAEAAPHLKLVPDRQAIGLYVAAGGRFGGGFESAGPVRTAGTSGGIPYDSTVETSGTTFPFRLKLGARYQPGARWLIDLGYRLSFETIRLRPRWTLVGGQQSGPPPEGKFDIDSWSVDLDVLRVSNPGRLGRWFAGLGVEMHSWTEPPEGSWTTNARRYAFWQGGSKMEIEYTNLRPASEKPVVRPSAVFGLEWRPQPRFGVALVTRVWPIPARTEFTYHTTVFAGGSTNTSERNDVVGAVDLPVVSFELTTAVYF